MKRNIGRVPVTKPLPAAALHPDMQLVLKNVLPLVKDKKTQHLFVRDLLKFQTTIAKRQYNPTQTVKTNYAGALSNHGLLGNYIDRIGLFNPQRFPINILEKMREDPQISLGMGITKGILRGLTWTVECSDPTQQRFVEYCLKKIYPQVIRSLSNALDFGFSSNEIIWEGRNVTLADIDPNTKQRKTYYKRYSLVIKNLIDHHPSSVRVVVDKAGQFLGISQYQNDGTYQYLPTGFKLLFFGIDQEFGNWFGRSRMINAYKAWYWSEIFTHFMARYLERRGTPPVIVQYPLGTRIVDGVEKDTSSIALDLGMSLVENALVVIPSEFFEGQQQWDIKYLSDDKRAEMFQQILNYLDILKLRGLCVPDRTVAQDLSPGGTAAGATSSRDIFLVTLASTIQELERTINDNVVVPLQIANFMESERVEIRFKYQPPDLDLKAITKEVMIETLRQTPNLIRMGKVPREAFPLGQLAKQLGMPIDDIENVYKDASKEVLDRLYNKQVANPTGQSNSPSRDLMNSKPTADKGTAPAPKQDAPTGANKNA